MKISGLVEAIFSNAVALDQSGGLRNTIYVIEDQIFILNYDHTILLRFKLRGEEKRFEHPISFKANDYDSNVFEEIENKIIFISNNGEFQRKKICGTTDLTPLEVQELYTRYAYDLANRPHVDLSAKVLELIDSDLSHIEFSGTKEEGIRMVQRNIYSGGIIEIEKVKAPLFDETLIADFGPIAIKTNDFKALFSIQPYDEKHPIPSLRFFFPQRDASNDFIIIKPSVSEKKRPFTAIVACCLYDEIIEIKESRSI